MQLWSVSRAIASRRGFKLSCLLFNIVLANFGIHGLSVGFFIL